MRVALGLLLVVVGCSEDAEAPEPRTELETPASEEGSAAPEPAEPELFRADGAPDPLACETDADCRYTPIPAAGGCCDVVPGAGTAASGAYALWLSRYRRDHCADVECPESTAWNRPERCEREIICREQRCDDSCDGIPDESDLPIEAVSLREAQRRALEATRGEPVPPSAERPRCARRPLDGVIVLGTFAHDRGCRLLGLFVGETFHEQPRAAAEAYLASVDWAGADERQREATAKDVGRHLLYAMRTVRAVEATTRDDGSVRVDLETLPPTGMRRRREPRPPSPHHFVIDASGRLR